MFNYDRRLFDEGDRGVGKSYLIKRLAKVSTLNGIFLEAVVKVGLREVLGALPAIRERESIYLRELEFGLFDGIADEELSALFPLEYTHYNKLKQAGGEYYARMPCGEIDPSGS